MQRGFDANAAEIHFAGIGLREPDQVDEQLEARVLGHYQHDDALPHQSDGLQIGDRIEVDAHPCRLRDDQPTLQCQHQRMSIGVLYDHGLAP